MRRVCDLSKTKMKGKSFAVYQCSVGLKECIEDCPFAGIRKFNKLRARQCNQRTIVMPLTTSVDLDYATEAYEMSHEDCRFNSAHFYFSTSLRISYYQSTCLGLNQNIRRERLARDR